MKKLTAIVASAVMLCSLVACTQKTDNMPNEQTDNPAVVDPTPDITPQPIGSIELHLFFPDDGANYLVEETRKVEKVSDSELPKLVIDELKKGPESEHLFPAVNGEFKILSVTVKNGVCTVDFSKEFADKNTGGTTKETFALQSIVHSLCQIDGIDKVKFNIDGDANAEFGGHYTIDEPFTPDIDILKPAK